MSTRNDEELRELLALEAVGALSDTERAELDDAIEGRPELRAELESLRGAAATMAEAVSEPPPPSLRARVLDDDRDDAAGAGAALRRRPPPLRSRRRRPSSPSPRRAATAGCGGVRSRPPRRPSPSACSWCPRSAATTPATTSPRCWRTRTRTTIELTGELSGLRLVHSAAANAIGAGGRRRAAARRRRRLRAVADRRADARADHQGVPARRRDGRLLMEGLDPGDDVFAVTVEPAGGSDEPTSDPVAVTA